MALFCRCLTALALVPLVGLTLTGCKTLDNFSTRLASSTFETVPGKFIDAVDERRLNATAQQPTNELGLSNDEIPIPQDSKRLPNALPLENYVQEMADRLMSSYPDPKRPIRVIIVEDLSYQASISPNGLANVSTGLLLNAASEDELAFVLAHEIAHVLLNHHAKEEIEQANDALFDGLALGAVLAAQLSGNEQAGTLIGGALLAKTAVSQGILSPSWSRNQEEEADLLGIDLMMRAGYNAEAALTSFQRMRAALRQKQVEEQKKETEFENHVRALAESGRISDGMNAALSRLSEAPSTILGEIWSSLTKTHPEPEKREYESAIYLDREYSEGPLPPPLKVAEYEENVFSGPALAALGRPVLARRAALLMSEDRPGDAIEFARLALSHPKDSDPELRQILFNAQLALGERDKALEHLELASTDNRAAPQIFYLLIDGYSNLLRFDAALNALNRLDRRYPHLVSANLPLRINIAIRRGSDVEARSALATCLDLRDTRIRQQCREVVKQAKSADARS